MWRFIKTIEKENSVAEAISALLKSVRKRIRISKKKLNITWIEIGVMLPISLKIEEFYKHKDAKTKSSIKVGR